MATVLGLLVGVDTYEGSVRSLHGCANDVRRARDVLARRAEAAGMACSFTMLLDEQATRDAVIRAFRATFGGAGPGDTAVFCYSGHGSQQEAPPEHLVFEPDGLDETLVLHDSRAPGGLDLADVELGALVREITARGAHVFVVLDCCHSVLLDLAAGTISPRPRAQRRPGLLTARPGASRPRPRRSAPGVWRTG